MRALGLVALVAVFVSGCGTPRPFPIYQPSYYSRQLLDDIDWRLRMQELDRLDDEIERMLQHRELMKRLDEIGR